MLCSGPSMAHIAPSVLHVIFETQRHSDVCFRQEGVIIVCFLSLCANALSRCQQQLAQVVFISLHQWLLTQTNLSSCYTLFPHPVTLAYTVEFLCIIHCIAYCSVSYLSEALMSSLGLLHVHRQYAWFSACS